MEVMLYEWSNPNRSLDDRFLFQISRFLFTLFFYWTCYLIPADFIGGNFYSNASLSVLSPSLFQIARGKNQPRHPYYSNTSETEGLLNFVLQSLHLNVFVNAGTLVNNTRAWGKQMLSFPFHLSSLHRLIFILPNDMMDFSLLSFSCWLFLN